LTFDHDIACKGGTTVGGWTQLNIHQSGNWNFSGHLRDSGFVDYDDAVVWAVKNFGTDEIFLFRHTGHMTGTAGLVFGGSRDDDWDDTGNNSPLADSWKGFFERGYGWQERSHAQADLESLVDDATKALGLAAAIIAVV
jgi:hypothetical protein